MTARTALVLTALLAGAPAARPADAPALSRFHYQERHMGTLFQITLYAADEATARRAARDAFARIAQLDDIMSDYRPTSELMRLCAKAGGPPVPVSKDLFAVLEKAQEVARRSDGAFDVTVGPVVRLWRVARRTQKLPDSDKLARARALVGYRKVRLDLAKHTVQLLTPGMQLDLGGIAKGYAADQAVRTLAGHGLPRSLVAAGGDIVAGDPPPDARAWSVAIAPLPGEKEPGPRLALVHAGVSTSGDANQFVVIDGKRYAHIVDPRTGLGLVGRMSVTVVAPNGTTSDPLATALCVLGPDKGLRLADDTPGVAARFVSVSERGVEVRTSKRFPQRVENKKRPRGTPGCAALHPGLY